MSSDKTLGMAWYKFLIYFALIAGAILNILYGINYISGGIYFVETNGKLSAVQVYTYYGTGLEIADILYGVFSISFAILAFIVRHKLANYTVDSIKFISIFYSVFTIVPLLYIIIVSAIIKEMIDDGTISSYLKKYNLDSH